VAALLTNAQARARELLTRHMEALHKLTTALFDQETISGDQVAALVQAASPAHAGGCPSARPTPDLCEAN
jgi:ATP-dependent Zn protease